MQAIYYQRIRETDFENKPMTQAIFALKARADANQTPIKLLFLSEEEFNQLETEIRSLAHDVNFALLKDITKGISYFLGLKFQVQKDLNDEIEINVDKSA